MRKAVILFSMILFLIPSFGFSLEKKSSAQKRPRWAQMSVSFYSVEAEFFVEDTSLLPQENGLFCCGTGTSLNEAMIDAVMSVGMFYATTLGSAYDENNKETFYSKVSVPGRLCNAVSTIDIYKDSDENYYVLVFISDRDLMAVFMNEDDDSRIEFIITSNDDTSSSQLIYTW